MFVFIDIAGDRQRKLLEVSQIAGSRSRRANLLKSRDEHATESKNNAHDQDADNPALIDAGTHI